ncbi:MAG: type II toxin-antitoxin system VapC family toxin [Actinomycetota bacterium]|nr:type II toxin-antitoxin system VapC family toxin [Actinomycetota bacterium]
MLVYAVGDHHPLRGPCRRIVQTVADGRMAASTTVEVIQEFVHVRARRRPRSDAVAIATDFVHLFSPLQIVDEDDLELGLRVFGEGGVISAFDAVLAASAIRHEAEALVSADEAFSNVPDYRTGTQSRFR